MSPPPGHSAAVSSVSSEAQVALASMAVETAGLRQAAGGSVADTVAEWLAGHYALAARQLAKEAGAGGMDLETLTALAGNIVALRKGDHSAARLRIETERLALERERDESRMRTRFEEWLKEPGIADRLCGPKLTPEERERRMRQIFNLAPLSQRGLSGEALAEIEQAMKML